MTETKLERLVLCDILRTQWFVPCFIQRRNGTSKCLSLFAVPQKKGLYPNCCGSPRKGPPETPSAAAGGGNKAAPSSPAAPEECSGGRDAKRPRSPSSPSRDKRERYGDDILVDEHGHRLPPPELRLVRYTRDELLVPKGCQRRRRQLHADKTRNAVDPWQLPLSEEQRRVWAENPHIRQALVNRRELFVVRNTPLGWGNRIATEGTPTMKYMRRYGEFKTVLHWGQRKLFFSELEFFLRYTSSRLPQPGKEVLQQVVYAGAAPGIHTNYLSDLFPGLRFHLVDPAPFSAVPT